ncbi:hypothetical protein OG429_20500 [Streptomyces sp. NBC_00190]|uniref:hypothetical protein n=1 Tax=unclassified Streptomyces TaxID=2593676 RepID=UPI002E2A5692|nr:hypothetical protein [Streptomyces sp. NBC_00190]WSZ41449.1 hypothetical protein OG239_23280 [Streptomyces sp. NBC_00868]
MQTRTKNPSLVLPDTMTGTGSPRPRKRLSPHLAGQQPFARAVLTGRTDPFNRVDAVVRAPTGTTSWI